MKTSRKELKRRARAALYGHYGTAVGGILLFYGISWLFTMALEIVVMIGGAFSFAFPSQMYQGIAVSSTGILAVVIIGVLLYLVLMVLLYLLMPGLIFLNMNLCKGENAKVGDIFWAFKHKPGKFILIALGIWGILFICLLPVVILAIGGALSGNIVFPAIFIGVYSVILTIVWLYFGLGFSMFYYILVEDPEKGIIEALKESYGLMAGSRLRFFGLGISFFGWMILGMMSFGIGMLWLIPYINCTCIFFYLDLKPQIETIPPDTAWNPYMEGFKTDGAVDAYEDTHKE